MNRIVEFLKKNKYVVLSIIILIGFVMYLLNITNSALWYDESVEYFYSKFLSGEAPGGFGMTNMYERICNTYQPPLYNVLMYIWLLFFDSGEFSFRLPGIIVTLLGAVGIYKCIENLCGEIYGFLGTLLYIFTFKVAFYALECGEYNLMLCCVCWMLYFFVKFIRDNNLNSLIGFFVFACLSVYSQYGAVFLVMALYIILVVKFSRNKKGLKNILVCTGIVSIVVVLPLIVFFMIPQMEHQGANMISHFLVFRENFVIDYFKGMLIVLGTIFSNNVVTMRIEILSIAIVFVAGIVSVVALFKKEKNYSILILACFISYSFYFIAVACSFYGYNKWNEKFGCFNIGGRYCLFFVPIIVVTLLSGICGFLNLLKKQEFKKVMYILVAIATIVFCSIGCYTLSVGWEKDDVRGVTQEWYDYNGYEVGTLVNQWSDANFQFYLIHNDNYEASYQDKIKVAEKWIRNAEYDEMFDGLKDMGIFNYNELYYVGPSVLSYKVFTEVMIEKGYDIEVLYDNYSVLLHLKK